MKGLLWPVTCVPGNYFKRNKRITNGLLDGCTTPSFLRLRLRLVDFFVRMWRLKAFWKVISPVPVTLNLFLALEFVLTFGILLPFINDTLLAEPHRRFTYGALWAMDA